MIGGMISNPQAESLSASIDGCDLADLTTPPGRLSMNRTESACVPKEESWHGKRLPRARASQVGRLWNFRVAALLVGLFIGSLHGVAQSAPSSATKPWFSAAERDFVGKIKTQTAVEPGFQSDKVYSLGELIDLAEQHNPDTRLAWQNAKMQAAALGVAKSSLYPALAGVALAGTYRYGQLIGNWNLQTIGLFQPTLNIDYLIFDFGGRSGAIAAAKANLFAANFAFNDTHRKIIYDVTSTCYRLLNAIGQRGAAEANLANAQALEKDAADRLAHGLATAPDLLEAKAARSHAEYELAGVMGAEEIAQGELATALGLPAHTVIPIQSIETLATPTTLAESADQMIDRAFQQRPDLMEQVAHLREADAELEQARSAYLPQLSFSSELGKQRAYGQQGSLPGYYATAPQFWNVQLNLKWTIFDGGKRESEVAAAKARHAHAQAAIDALRDEISDEVWKAYSSTKTAFRQQDAASTQLQASQESYASALRAYDLGVRNLLDVLAAQRALAEARTADITARTEVLSQVANLAFKTADLLHPSAVNPHP